MFYKKNVGTAERVARVALGCALAIGGFMGFGQSAPAWIAVSSGVVAVATGLVGFCPACAMVGRRERG